MRRAETLRVYPSTAFTEYVYVKGDVYVMDISYVAACIDSYTMFAVLNLLPNKHTKARRRETFRMKFSRERGDPFTLGSAMEEVGKYIKTFIDSVEQPRLTIKARENK